MVGGRLDLTQIPHVVLYYLDPEATFGSPIPKRQKQAGEGVLAEVDRLLVRQVEMEEENLAEFQMDRELRRSQFDFNSCRTCRKWRAVLLSIHCDLALWHCAGR